MTRDISARNTRAVGPNFNLKPKCPAASLRLGIAAGPAGEAGSVRRRRRRRWAAESTESG